MKPRNEEERTKATERNTPFFGCVFCYALLYLFAGVGKKKSRKDGMKWMLLLVSKAKKRKIKGDIGRETEKASMRIRTGMKDEVKKRREMRDEKEKSERSKRKRRKR